LAGDSLPPIRHITEIKAVGDTLWFVSETEDGFGQRFLRKAVICRENNTLDVGPELGRKSNGYFMAYMLYPVNGIDGKMQVVNQEDGEIFGCENYSVLKARPPHTQITHLIKIFETIVKQNRDYFALEVKCKVNHYEVLWKYCFCVS